MAIFSYVYVYVISKILLHMTRGLHIHMPCGCHMGLLTSHKTWILPTHMPIKRSFTCHLGPHENVMWVPTPHATWVYLCLMSYGFSLHMPWHMNSIYSMPRGSHVHTPPPTPVAFSFKEPHFVKLHIPLLKLKQENISTTKNLRHEKKKRLKLSNWVSYLAVS